tara:strand:+ start:235 stop:447 length:213 start_codon:yes stop_codon:yes gene_type:complete
MVKVETKKIGGSLCVFIPNDVVNEKNLKPNQKIDIEIRKPVYFENLRGSVKNPKYSPEEVLQEIDDSEDW